MVNKMITLTLCHKNDESLINDAAVSVNTICEETNCQMTWGDPTSETISWDFFTRNSRQEECVRSMLMDLVYDYPYCVTVD